MPLPKVSDAYQKDRLGVNAVERFLLHMKHVWRENPNADVGIDGQIEFVNDDDCATGVIVAVQIKSGTSYFERETPTHIPFYPAPKHREYWARFPIPVVLILYHSDRDEAYFADARQALRDVPAGSTKPILVPKHQTMQPQNRTLLFAAYGPIDEAILPVSDLIPVMLRARAQNAGFDVSFFSLFTGGLMDISRKLYFGMDLCNELAEFSLDIHDSEFGIGLGGAEYDFLDAYVGFLTAQNLAIVDYTDYVHDRDVRQMTPTSIWPLTHRGKELVEAIRMQWEKFDLSAKLIKGCMPYKLAQVMEMARNGTIKALDVLRGHSWIDTGAGSPTIESLIRLEVYPKLPYIIAFERAFKSQAVNGEQALPMDAAVEEANGGS